MATKRLVVPLRFLVSYFKKEDDGTLFNEPTEKYIYLYECSECGERVEAERDDVQGHVSRTHARRCKKYRIVEEA